MSRPESRIILTTRPPCRSWCSARRIRSCATSSSASPAPTTTRNLMSRSCSTASPAARAAAAAKNAPNRPQPQPPSTRCSPASCDRIKQKGAASEQPLFYAPIFFFSSAICSLCIRISDFRKETSSSSSSRVYLRTHDVTGSEGFLRCARHFFAGILTYFK